MIGRLLFAVINSTWGRYLLIGLAILGAAKGWGAMLKREGRRDERSRRAVETLKTMRRMQDAGAAVATDRAAIIGRLRSGQF